MTKLCPWSMDAKTVEATHSYAHARRGVVILLTPDTDNTGKILCHVLDYCSKRMPRVTRSTFAVELQGVS
eukprot:5152926-Amphidinium_carterae.2